MSVALAADDLQVTAVGSSRCGALASTRVPLSGPGAGPRVDPLNLASGSTCAAEWLPTFGGRPGVGGTVYALAVFDDGSGPALYVGGDFALAGGTLAEGVARWDGVAWTTLGSGLNDTVRELIVHDDGSGPALYAGGEFTSAGGSPANHVARWDGSSWSALGSGMNDWVRYFVVHDDGSGSALYAAGSFTTAGGVAANRIARWDGASWSAVGLGMDDTVFALAVHDDGSGAALYAGGAFTTAGGSPASHVARWNGSGWSALSTGMNNWVFALAEYDHGFGPSLYAGGAFTTAGGAAASGIARWNGSGWSALGGGVTNGDVRALAVHDDGSGPKLHVGGTFLKANGNLLEARRIARWNGFSWSALAPGFTGGVQVMVSFDDGSGPALYFGGSFCSLIVIPSEIDFCDPLGILNNLARRQGAGALEPVGPGPNGNVRALAVHDDGSGAALYAGGSFGAAGGVPVRSIARWDGDGWGPVGTGVSGSFGATASIHALAEFDDGSGPALYVGGTFVSAGGSSASLVARWNGAAWSALGSGLSGANASVRALAVFDDGGGPALYAAGRFTSAGGGPANHIARWNGASWSALGSGLDDEAWSLVVHDDGSGPALYVGGRFASAGGVPASRVARWDGSAWSDVGGGVSSWVNTLAVHDDGSGPALFAAGWFASAGAPSVPASRIAKWDGSSWSALGSGMDLPVDSLASFDDGSGPTLVASGWFSVAGGLAVNRIARWDGSAWAALGSGLFGSTQSSATSLLVHDGALLVGGSFTSAIDSGDSHVARFGRPEDTQAPVLDCPDLVTVLDTLGTPPGEVVTFSVSASDGCDPAPSVVCVPPSGTFFPRGTTIVTCTATDASGNESTCQFPVLVQPKARRR